MHNTHRTLIVAAFVAYGLSTGTAAATSCAARQLPNVATWMTEDVHCFQIASGRGLEQCRTEAALGLIEAIMTTSDRHEAQGHSCPPAFSTAELYDLVDTMSRRTLLFIREVGVKFDLTVPADRRLAARLIDDHMAPSVEKAIRKARYVIQGRRVRRYARGLARLHLELQDEIRTIQRNALAQGVGSYFYPSDMADVAISLAVDLVDTVAEAGRIQ